MSSGEAASGGGPTLAERLAEFERQAGEVTDRQGWEELRREWLGRKQGLVRRLLADIGGFEPAKRRDYGREVNELKGRVEEQLAEIDRQLTDTERRAEDRDAAIDVTLPGRRPSLGATHPVNQVVREIAEIFAAMGYSVAEGPEVEDDFHNFESLNFPADHPARDEQDTFFLTDGRLLRTHTSPVQIRTMLARESPPIRIICPGRVFRNDNDLRHSPVFHQVEALAVDRGITFGDLKGTLEAFIHRLFSPDTGVRLRPSYFPFTEPSAEVDITCPFCAGEGCRVCSQTGWMEILGAGMVNPRVLAACGIDPAVYSGFAFGLGVDRVAMIRYGIPNIRLLFDSDERLLRQVLG